MIDSVKCACSLATCCAAKYASASSKAAPRSRTRTVHAPCCAKRPWSVPTVDASDLAYVGNVKVHCRQLRKFQISVNERLPRRFLSVSVDVVVVVVGLGDIGTSSSSKTPLKGDDGMKLCVLALSTAVVSSSAREGNAPMDLLCASVFACARVVL